MSQLSTDTTLWAVHVQGPDDVIAAADRDEADTRADQINGVVARFAAGPDVSPHDPPVRAVVIEWPYSVAAHVERLAAGDRRWQF